MKPNIIIAIVVIIFVILGSFGVYRLYQKRISLTPEPSPLPSPSLGFPPSQATTPSIQPEAGVSASDVKKAGITVVEPQSQSTVSSPVKISGFANSSGKQQTLARIKDTSGKILGESSIESCREEFACPFEIVLVFSNPTTASGTIEVYNQAPITGMEENLKVIPIKFR